MNDLFPGSGSRCGSGWCLSGTVAVVIYWLTPVPPGGTVSGGTRKLWDLCAVLAKHGWQSEWVTLDGWNVIDPAKGDLLIVPEVYGTSSGQIAGNCAWVSFIQNGYLMDPAAYIDVPQLAAVFVESQHTARLVRERVRWLSAPTFLMPSSGNGRMGEDAGFRFGEWPRRKVVMYFGYKHKEQNRLIFDDLELPPGWWTQELTGTDEEVAAAMRTGAIFAAPLAIEGMCAPTQEAMISGALIVCWPGGPSKFAHHPTPRWAWSLVSSKLDGGPVEYLRERCFVAAQDDVEAFRDAVVQAAKAVDEMPDQVAEATREWSEWMRTTYSREREVAALFRVMEKLAPMAAPPGWAPPGWASSG